jgi:Na+-transporting NADH:ubiquinone oxidoreductase subunit B
MSARIFYFPVLRYRLSINPFYIPMAKIQFLTQKNMLRVLYALTPVLVVSIYFFGWRVAVILAVSTVCAFLTEWYMTAVRKGKISFACFVTASLYALSLPPTIPFWIAAVGAIVAILFAKEAFGGFGKNIFNPAIVGRAFVYVCFPVEMTSRFVGVFTGLPGGFAQWSFVTLKKAPLYLADTGITVANAVTAATPMWARRDYGYEANLVSLVVGNIQDTFNFKETTRVLAAGSIGETSALVLIIVAIYLIITKTAQWRLMLATVLGAGIMNIFLRTVLGIETVPPLPFTLFSGALLYAAVFMVTDPVSAPKQRISQWIYGFLIGALIVFFRYKAVFAGGVGFAILIGNAFSPSLDLWLKRFFTAGKKAEVPS